MKVSLPSIPSHLGLGLLVLLCCLLSATSTTGLGEWLPQRHRFTVTFLDGSAFFGGGEHSHDGLDLCWSRLRRSDVLLLYSLNEVDSDTSKWVVDQRSGLWPTSSTCLYGFFGLVIARERWVRVVRHLAGFPFATPDQGLIGLPLIKLSMVSGRHRSPEMVGRSSLLWSLLGSLGWFGFFWAWGEAFGPYSGFNGKLTILSGWALKEGGNAPSPNI